MKFLTRSAAEEGEYRLYEGEEEGDGAQDGVDDALLEGGDAPVHQEGDQTHQARHQGQAHQHLVQAEPGVLPEDLAALQAIVHLQSVMWIRMWIRWLRNERDCLTSWIGLLMI
jgi:hypothetical protein